jgi:hypothetical protein
MGEEGKFIDVLLIPELTHLVRVLLKFKALEELENGHLVELVRTLLHLQHLLGWQVVLMQLG